MEIKLLVKKALLFLTLLAIVFPTVRQIIRPGSFPVHDDIQAMRLLEMNQCFKDLQIPCRWVPDMGYGYGYPQFNYYGPLPYYMMEGFHLAGLGYLDSVKAGLILITLISAVGIFILGKSLWGTTGGLIGTILYIYAPYRALDFYVRGDIAELAALATFPYLFWSVRSILLGKKKSVIWLALSLAALFTSHNISTLIFIPVLGLWTVFIVMTNRKEIILYIKERTLSLALGGVWGLLIGSFFIIPAWFEKGYVHIETLLSGYFNYLAHYVSINQLLFSTYWNYGSSELGPWDELYLGIGILHWLLPLIVLPLLYFLKRKKQFWIVLFLTVVGWIALFLTHEKSTFVWKSIPILVYLQFPWRFLIIATFVFSLAVGSLSQFFLNLRGKVLMTITIVIFSLLMYSSYFHPSSWLNITDQEKFSGHSLLSQEVTSIFDYLPIYAKAPPGLASPNAPVFIQGQGEIIGGGRKSNSQNWEVNIEGNNSILELPTFYFPGWKVYIDGNEQKIDYSNDLGLIRVNVSLGEHNISAKLTNTPIRTIANTATILGLALIPVFITFRKKWKN